MSENVLTGQSNPRVTRNLVTPEETPTEAPTRPVAIQRAAVQAYLDGINNNTATTAAGAPDQRTISSNPDQGLADVAYNAEQRFNAYGMPLIDEQLATVGSGQYTTDAIESVSTNPQNEVASQTRQMGRYGLQMTPEQLKAQQRRNSINRATSGVGTISGARMADKERDISVVGTLSNQAQGLSDAGGAGMLQASQRNAQRTLANKQASQAHTQQMIGLGTTALMAAFMM